MAICGLHLSLAGGQYLEKPRDSHLFRKGKFETVVDSMALIFFCRIEEQEFHSYCFSMIC